MTGEPAAHNPAGSPRHCPHTKICERSIAMTLLFMDWLGTPVWFWMCFLALVLALSAFDLGLLNRGEREMGVRRSLSLSGLYIAIALAFGLWVWQQKGADPALDYYTGFFVEKSLSIDNIFVISLIFAAFSIPARYQYRVLVWGIVAVILLRGAMIGAGTALVAEFAWMLYLFAAFLVVTGIRMVFARESTPDIGANRLVRWLSARLRMTEGLHGQRFFVRVPDARTGKRVLAATPLFLALVVINVADLVFAVDSVPAIFAITTDPFIVYTSNIMAILGLRALYFALAAIVHRFHYLKHALALVLIFIGSKIFVADFLLDTGKFPPLVSLAVTLGLILGGIVASLLRPTPAARA
jgi:tellurite resistance protein TerC